MALRVAKAERTALILVTLMTLLVALSAEALPFSFSKTIGVSYQEGDEIPVMVSPLSSKMKVMPMAWRSVKWCPLASKLRRRNIGQLLFGDNMEESGYSLPVGENITCKTLCTVTLNEAEQNYLKKLIDGRYRGNVYVDDLPGVEDIIKTPHSRRVRTGFSLGVPALLSTDRGTLVNNHLVFTIAYHAVNSLLNDDARPLYRIVHFQVSAMSINHKEGQCDVSPAALREPKPAQSDSISFSYSVNWIESDLEWSTRWDVYMKLSGKEARVHWFSIVNFFFVMLLQTLALWYVLVRALRRDLSYYNDPDAEDREETGWKLVHGDVFRRPRGVGLLSICVGTGTQLALMAFSGLAVACFGFISPQSRGLLATLLVLLFVLFSFFNGLVTAMLIRFFKMRSWKTIFATSIFYPAQMFAAYVVLNFIHVGNHAASAASFWSFIILLLLWQGVSMPLIVVGAAIGFGIELHIPVKVNNIPRTIPPAPWFMDSVFAIILPGLVPFAASHVEVTYIFGSVWHGSVYYMFGFLMAVYLLSMVISAQTAVFATYIYLNRLNYHWWWRSFMTSASYGLWIFTYSIIYYFRYSTLKGFMSTALFFGYMVMASYTLSLLSGAVGFIASFVFVKVIYSSVKVE